MGFVGTIMGPQGAAGVSWGSTSGLCAHRELAGWRSLAHAWHASLQASATCMRDMQGMRGPRELLARLPLSLPYRSQEAAHRQGGAGLPLTLAVLPLRRRTFKFLQGVLGAKWVLEEGWLAACLEQGRVADEVAFQVRRTGRL